MEQNRGALLEQQIIDEHQRTVDAAMNQIAQHEAAQEAKRKDEESRGIFHKKKPDPSLPQNDSDPKARKAAIKETRYKYKYNHDYLSPLPMLESVPKEEAFSTKYKLGRGLKTAKVFGDVKLAKLEKVLNPPKSLESFEHLFQLLPNPTTLNTWRTDAAFGEQRLSGANPMKLTTIATWSQMPFKLGSKSTKIPGYNTTYEDAIKQGRLFYVDYSDLSFVSPVMDSNDKMLKYLPVPKAVFFWSTEHSHAWTKQLMGHANHGQLMPVAIQVKPDDPIYTPQSPDPIDWMMAKMCVQVADSNHHEMGPHLCHTHFVMAPFAISMARQMAENHPVSLLLKPHFRFLLVNNEAGRTSLIQPHGPVDNLLAGSIEDSHKIITNEYKLWSIKEFSFMKHIKNRGLDDTEALPHYPYRDDGLLIWNAISKFISKYIKYYYKNNAAVKEDIELQAWAAELADEQYGRVKDMPAQIKTRIQLIDLLTNLLFTCSGQHSAVNFSQYDYMANLPNMPLAAYCPFEQTEAPKTIDDVINFLPKERISLMQLEVVSALTVYHYDRLGFYNKHDFEDDTVLSFIKDFQQELDLAEHQINLRNTARDFPYKFLKPSEILNSISI